MPVIGFATLRRFFPKKCCVKGLVCLLRLLVSKEEVHLSSGSARLHRPGSRGQPSALLVPYAWGCSQCPLPSGAAGREAPQHAGKAHKDWLACLLRQLSLILYLILSCIFSQVLHSLRCVQCTSPRRWPRCCARWGAGMRTTRMSWRQVEGDSSFSLRLAQLALPTVGVP